MDIKVNEELRAYIDPLTPEEHDALERSLLAEGCRDALVLWGDVLVDGHNRYGICRKHNIPFTTVQNPRFKSLEDVHLWMIDQHLGRRSVSDFQRGVLALRKKDILAARAQVETPAPDNAAEPTPDTPPPPAPEPLNTREAIAKAARISSNTVAQIEKIHKTAAPELVAAVKSGTISINAAAAVASLPAEEQVAAVAGGKKELRQAAKLVREAKAKTKAPAAPAPEEAASAPASPSLGVNPFEADGSEEEIARLTRQVEALTAENLALKEQVRELRNRLGEHEPA
ncbi:plasmid replication/partition related protein [Aquabacterium sp. A7-Y]|uniref:plasmid replication/partition related protein n=1 Tax=Aquabacterium sp. A7-Y TaxID=1349605 RepID=UPI00223D8908|nr:plasmid replication/partition related protein [Aquabacterium sp. A7-Y]MCW7540951.1 plasmid replication/partition related protein [Aquabacterium sp. A7-Y]